MVALSVRFFPLFIDYYSNDMKKSILYFAVFIIVNVIVSYGGQGILALVYGSEHNATIPQLLIMSAVNSAIVIALFIALKWCPVSREYVRTRPWATFFWVVLLALGSIMPLAWLESLIPDELTKDFVGDVLAQMLGTTEGYFVICMLAPLAEEIVFRGAVIRSIVEWGRNRRLKHIDAGNTAAVYSLSDTKIQWVAIIISAVLFAIAHLNPAQMPHALVVGILLGWLFVETGSIVPGFLFHWINNSAAYVMVKLFPSMPIDAPLEEYFSGNTIAMYQAVISSLCIALPALYQLIVRRV